MRCSPPGPQGGVPARWSACRATRASRGHPIWFSRELIAEFLALPETAPRATWSRATPTQTEFLDLDDPGIVADIDDAARLPAASPEPPYEAPPRPALQDCRRAAGLFLLVAGFVAPICHRRPVRPTASRPRSGALSAGSVEFGKVALQPLQRPRLLGGQRDHPRRPRHRHGAHRVYGPGTMEVAPSIWSLLGGTFVIASIRLEGASINLTKSGPASEWGHWNFSSIVNRSVMRAAPAIHVRDSRINFKFGDTKSGLLPHRNRSRYLAVRSRRRLEDRLFGPTRAHRPSRAGAGILHPEGPLVRASGARGSGLCKLDRAGAGRNHRRCMSGQDGSVHGTLSSRLHLGGPAQQYRHHGPPGYRRRAPLGHDARQQARAGRSTDPRAPRPDRPADSNCTPPVRAMRPCR